MQQVKRHTLKKQAEENLSVKRNKKVEKEGVPLDHASKHGVPIQTRSVGMNKGITRNMGDFESLRVDVWLTDFVADDETSQEALARVEEIIDETLEEAVLSMIDDD